MGHDGAFTPEENRASGPATRLQAQLERIDVARRSLTSSATRLRRHMKSQMFTGTITAKCSNVALVLHVLGAGNVDACMAYLRDNCGEYWDAALQHIEHRFLTLPLQELVKIGDPNNPWNSAAEKKAKRFLEDFKLAAWVRSQNEEKGVAPAFRHIASRKRSCRAYGVPEPPAALTRTGRGEAQWVRRWMRRWKGARRKIPVHEAENPDEVTKKATHHTTFFLTKDVSEGPVLGSKK